MTLGELILKLSDFGQVDDLKVKAYVILSDHDERDILDVRLETVPDPDSLRASNGYTVDEIHIVIDCG